MQYGCCRVCDCIMVILDAIAVLVIGIGAYFIILLVALCCYEVGIARAMRKIQKEKEKEASE